MLKERRRRLRSWSVNRIVPNGLTVLALCAGLTSIRFSLDGRWDFAVCAIVIAGIFDGLDGRAARILKVTSRFGAELDSLSDFLSFGVAPAVLVYEWSLSGVRGIGWALALLFTVCCALRLARFNSEMEEPMAEQTEWSRDYFAGVPAPAGAALAIVPIMIWLETDGDYARLAVVNGLVMGCVALLMISRVPTFSMKRFTIPISYVLPVLLVIGLMFAALVSAPWPTLITIGLAYLFSIPVTVFNAYRKRRCELEGQSAENNRGMPPPEVDPVATAVHKRNGEAGLRH